MRLIKHIHCNRIIGVWDNALYLHVIFFRLRIHYNSSITYSEKCRFLLKNPQKKPMFVTCIEKRPLPE